MCSASRKRWSYDMTVGFASVCFSVALLCTVSCAAQSTVKPGVDNTGITTEWVTTLILETNTTVVPGPIVTTNSSTNPEQTSKTDGSPNNGNISATTTASPAGTTSGSAVTTAGPTTPAVPSSTKSTNCTDTGSNCTTTPVPGSGTEVMPTQPASVSATATPVAENKTDNTSATTSAPGGTTGAAGKPSTQKPEPTTLPKVTTAAKTEAPQKTTTKAPTEEPTTKAPPKPLTTGAKHLTTDEHEKVVPKKSSQGHKTAVVVTVIVFAIALVALIGVGYVYRKHKLRNNYGRLNEETDDSGWSAFSKNPIYRGDRDHQPL